MRSMNCKTVTVTMSRKEYRKMMQWKKAVYQVKCALALSIPLVLFPTCMIIAWIIKGY